MEQKDMNQEDFEKEDFEKEDFEKEDFELDETKQVDKPVVLCAANAYTKKYFLAKEFEKLPEGIKEELQIICVTFTEDVGGIITIEFDPDGNINVKTMSDEQVYLYDEISAGLRARELQKEKQELFEALEMYFKIVFLGQQLEEEY